MKKILITGANGLLGKRFNKLFGKKYIIYNVFRNKKELKSNEFNVNLENTEEVEKLFNSIDKIDIVLHFAAQPVVWKSKQDPVGDAKSNIIATLNVINFSIEKKVKQFIFTSSETVYGNYSSPDEDSPKHPIVPYGIAKYSCENYISYFKTSTDIDFRIVRPSFIIDMDMNRNPLFDILSQIKTGKIKLYNSLESEYNFVSSESVCDVIDNMIDGSIDIEDLNIVNSYNTKLKDIFSFLSKRYDAQVEYLSANIQKATMSSKHRELLEKYGTNVQYFCLNYLDEN